ncbi:MAG: NAD-dependent epimerase/dehydratase family protein [Pseudomonadales bacterium]|nr:NAD-dependent epimerase/dehydratase family protein [Pseudomonadales bacterium]
MQERDFNKTTGLGYVLVTGGAGFVGTNFVKALLDVGIRVRSFDRADATLSHENLDIVQGDIRDMACVEKAVAGIDTIFHTASVIELKGGRAVSKEYRDFSYSINVEGTQNLLKAARAEGTKRFIYTASNSVVLEGKPVRNGTEDLPYTQRFDDLYTETKVVAEKWVLAQNNIDGLLTCSIRPSSIWGPGDQTMFKQMFEQMIAGLYKARVGMGNAKLDNSYVHNLIHGQILAAKHLVRGGTSEGQAYFINDGEPVNVFEFSRPVLEAINYPFPTIKIPAALIKSVMALWQFLHFKFSIPEPPIPPLAVERIAVDNYFSIEKAKTELGYEPLYTTAQGMTESMPYYKTLYKTMCEEKQNR